jgi:hypothetical protein
MTKYGIHLPNGSIRDLPGMLAVGFEHFTLLDGEAGHIPALRAASPHGVILVRMYQPKWSDLDPVTWADHCVSEYDRMRQAETGWSMRSLNCHITPANEMNLEVPEGGGSTYEWYQRIALWLNRWLDRVGTQIPKARLHFPAFAYGHSDDDNTRGYCGMEVCRSAIERFGVLDVHPYWFEASEVALDWRGARFIRSHNLFPTMPIFLSEAGNFAVTRSTAPAEMVAWFGTLAQYDYVIGGTPFIWEDPTGAHSINDWSRNPAIAQAVKTAIAQEGEAPQPGGNDMTQAELLRYALDIWGRFHAAPNPTGAIFKHWMATLGTSAYPGFPMEPEHPTENGKWIIQGFSSGFLSYEIATGRVSAGLPL